MLLKCFWISLLGALCSSRGVTRRFLICYSRWTLGVYGATSRDYEDSRSMWSPRDNSWMVPIPPPPREILFYSGQIRWLLHDFEACYVEGISTTFYLKLAVMFQLEFSAICILGYPYLHLHVGIVGNHWVYYAYHHVFAIMRYVQHNWYIVSPLRINNANALIYLDVQYVRVHSDLEGFYWQFKNNMYGS